MKVLPSMFDYIISNDLFLLTVKKRAFLYYSFLATFFFIISCKQRAHTDNHKQIQEAFQRMDTSYKRLLYFPQADLENLDAAFAIATNPGIADLAEKYRTKTAHFSRDFYRGPRPDYDKAIVYADSCINLLRDHTDVDSLAKLYARAFFLKGDIYFTIKKL